jgi:small subunit ribosomal protein S15
VKDTHSRYGLIKMVGQRKRLLEYLRRNDTEAYQKIIARLDLRK